MEKRAVHRKTQTWRAEEDFPYMQKLFSIVFRTKFSLVSEITLSTSQYSLWSWEKWLFLLRNFQDYFCTDTLWTLPGWPANSCYWTPHLANRHHYHSCLSFYGEEQEGDLDCQPWEKMVAPAKESHCQEGSATNHTALPLIYNCLKSPEEETHLFFLPCPGGCFLLTTQGEVKYQDLCQCM